VTEAKIQREKRAWREPGRPRVHLQKLAFVAIRDSDLRPFSQVRGHITLGE